MISILFQLSRLVDKLQIDSDRWNANWMPGLPRHDN
jgi:hypothetical protein